MAGKMDRCLVDGCSNPQETRGQCSGCYRDSRKLIAAGKTTWAKLESQGLARPRKQNKVAAAIARDRSEKRRSGKR